MRAETQLTARGANTLPQSTAAAIFNVQGGKVQILELCGEVTTLTPSGANNTKLIANPTTGADVDLCATLDIASKAVGVMLRVNGDLSDALEAATSGAQELLGDYKPMVVAPGTIDLSCSASKTGAIKWSCLWRPLDPGARVVAA